jgi:pyruvate dehydrogenase E2 component (dihydrolipoamide acetyltransferase)
MAEFIKMPSLGFDMEEGVLGSWLKQVGDPVAIGDVLAEIESDKVTQELTARHAGVLLAQFVQAGDVIPVGSDIGLIGAAGEDISAASAPSEAPAEQMAAAPESEPISAPITKASVAVSTGAATPIPQQPTTVQSIFSGEVRATPVARRLAAEKGIDLTKVAGSGPHGRIRKADIESFVPSAPITAATVEPTVAMVTPPVGVDASAVEISRLRKAIARRMTESKQTVPHLQVTTAIDMTDALELRTQINAALPADDKASVNDLVVKACGMALRQFPNLNASWGGDKIIHHQQINVGIAVAVEGGLLTVVSKKTDSASMSRLARQNREMIERARSGRVQPEDVQGSTFTVSNLGAYDVYEAVAIINPPEAAILMVGTANAEPVVRNGEIVVRNIMRATCSADHRITDGAEVAQFLQAFKAILEAPLQLLL